jgi:uncharacterized membrane protein
MSRTLLGCIAISLFFLTVISAQAQSSTGAAPHAPAAKTANPPNPPDMVCFGEGPKWSIQFVSWGARYLGINEPNRDFLGGFFWVPDQNAWVWQRKNGLAPMNGGYTLSAIIQKDSCTDPESNQKFPYSAQVNMPQGDMVSGCCRKLKPGEAPVGPHGVPSGNTPAH